VSKKRKKGNGKMNGVKSPFAEEIKARFAVIGNCETLVSWVNTKPDLSDAEFAQIAEDVKKSIELWESLN
jgi:hypothetical protein